MNLNEKRCLELLKERKKLKKEGKQDWNNPKDDEIIEYFSLLED